jgi:hypothetical protein
MGIVPKKANPKTPSNDHNDKYIKYHDHRYQMKKNIKPESPLLSLHSGRMEAANNVAKQSEERASPRFARRNGGSSQPQQV